MVDKYVRWRQISLFALILAAVEIAILNIPGTHDVVSYQAFIEVGRQVGILKAYKILGVRGWNAPADEAFYLSLFTGKYGTHLNTLIGGAIPGYPPLSVMILASLSKIADLFHARDFLVFKFSLAAFTAATAIIASRWRGIWSPGLGLAVFGIVAYDASLSYIDSYFLFFFAIALHYLEQEKNGRGGLFFALSAFTKWQPIILGPLLLLYILKPPISRKEILQLIPGALVIVAVFATYGKVPILNFFPVLDTNSVISQGLNLNYVYSGLYELFTHTLDAGSVAKLSNANSHPFVVWLSTPLSFIVYVLGVWHFYRSRRTILDFIESCIICFMSYLMFFRGVHENHAMLVALLGVYWIAANPARLLDGVALILVCALNLYIFYGSTGDVQHFPRVLFGLDQAFYLAAINVIYAGFLIYDVLLRRRAATA